MTSVPLARPFMPSRSFTISMMYTETSIVRATPTQYGREWMPKTP